jgi:hypothetical protein
VHALRALGDEYLSLVTVRGEGKRRANV